MDKLEILKTSLDGRNQSIMMYQINIDNYTRALDHIATLSPAEQQQLEKFSEQLRALLITENLEQSKEKVLAHVIDQQIQELEAAAAVTP
jgi:uncharacterized coiled-coil DUF342 family protein